MPTNFEYCAARVREADRDRYLATLFAPAGRREALFALYAFNTEIARVRGLAREPMPGEIRLQWWREVLAGERVDEAQAHPAAAALLETLARHRIGTGLLVGLLDAHAFDLYDEPMATLADLQRYGIATRSTLLSVTSEILGAAAPEALTQQAGLAQTVARVLQDFALHASRRQLYVPLDVLARAGAERENIFAARPDQALHAALNEMRSTVRNHLAAAAENIGKASEAILPALLPLALVGPTLRAMEQRDYDPFRSELLPAWRRQWLIWRAARDPSRIFRA